MTVQLDHTIVAAADKAKSAQWLADILGLTVSPQYGPFLPVETANGVKLDFRDVPADQVIPQHYAFLVSEQDFDTIFERVRQAGIRHYARPGHQQPDEINHNDGGRGTYFDEPNGHSIEIITRPYGSGE
jgi:catechol 2,3-dioxygenase-like lactoylglutathione lyase family enzyme